MKPQILFIEDSLTLYETVALYIEHQFKLVHAKTGKEALDLMNGEYEAALLDLNLPDMYGADIIPDLLKREIPIIVLTGEKHIEKVAKLINSGDINDYISKPVDPFRLKKSLEMITGYAF